MIGGVGHYEDMEVCAASFEQQDSDIYQVFGHIDTVVIIQVYFIVAHIIGYIFILIGVVPVLCF